MNTKIILFIIIFIAVFSVAAFSTWTEPSPVTVANDPSAEDWSPFLTFDGLTLYFARVRSATSYYGKICTAARNSLSEPFTSIQILDCPLNDSPGHQLCPWVSCDNLRLYYHNETSGIFHLMYSERASIEEPWPAGKSLEQLNLLGNRLQAPSLTQDELIIFFDASDISGGKGSYDIWMATRPDQHSSFTSYRNLSEINTSSSEGSPFISANGLELYFSSNRNGKSQLFKATRNSLYEAFGNIRTLSQFDIEGKSVSGACISYNGQEMFFMRAKESDRSTRDIYTTYSTDDSYYIYDANDN